MVLNGTKRSRRVRRSRRAGLAVALAGALALVAAACDTPTPSAGRVFDAWKAGKPAAASHDATPTVINTLTGHPYSSASLWFFNRCDGAAGSTFCTWINRTESQLILRVNNQNQVVIGAQFVVFPNTTSGQFFHSWRVQNRTAAGQFGSAAAVSSLFSHPYHPTAHWTPDGCQGAAGSVFCTWSADNGNQIITQLDNVQTHKVIGAQYVRAA
jgi:hypothetical protein